MFENVMVASAAKGKPMCIFWVPSAQVKTGPHKGPFISMDAA